MSCQFVEQLRPKAEPTSQLYRVLTVSRSGYFTACKRNKDLPADCKANVQLKAAFAACGGAFGYHRLRKAMASRGT